ncbi:MAG: cardiolipin synthase [Pseudomonadota bacterium]
MIDTDLFAVIAVVIAGAEVVGLLLAVNAVMGRRSSQGAIAWFIALITMPLVTVPCYLVFGRTRFLGYAEALREAADQVGAQVADWRGRMAAFAVSPDKELEAVEAVVRRLDDLPFTRFNDVALLIDGEATYDAMIEAVERARAYVLVQFYIVRDDAVGRRLRDALIARAQAGVRVSFLYDEIGCLQLAAGFLGTLRAAGVLVSGFRTTRGLRNRFQINFRNHRKLLIVDGQIGFIGGHNLGEEYLEYRDCHLRLEGPAAQKIQFAFLKDWYWATRQVPDISDEIAPAVAGDETVAIVTTGPADGMASCSVLFTTLINTARRRLWLTSPFFVPDDALVRALQAAALRGVDVRVILPGKSGHWVVDLASHTYYPDMIDAGVQLFRYRERFLHQKVLLVDDGLASIGTVNLDNRSLYLNFEVTALVADEKVAGEVDAMLRRDLSRCEPVERAHYDARPNWFRAATRIARLASPLL